MAETPFATSLQQALADLGVPNSVEMAAAINEAVADVVGGASSDGDTLKKLLDGISALALRVAILEAAGPAPEALAIEGEPTEAVAGEAYSWTPTVTGGSGAKTFSVDPALPDGLSLNTATGEISGTPTGAATYTGVLTVEDSTGEATLPLALITGGGGQPITTLFKVFGETSANAASADRTRPMAFRRKRPWKRVRAAVFSVTSLSGLKVSFAPSASAASPTVPSGGLAALQQLTFNTTSLAASTVPASGQASAVPAVTWSDWVDIPSLERTDGGEGHLFMARCYQDASSSGVRASHATGAPPTDIDTYGYWVGNTVAGDFTQAAATFTTDTNGFPIYFEFEDDDGPAQIAVVGPSTIQGRDNYGLKVRPSSYDAVEELRDEGQDVEWVQFGWNGASTSGSTGTPPAQVAGYWGQFLRYMETAGRLPDVVAFMPACGNNTNFMAAAGVTESDYWCGVFADWCAENGVKGILITPTPRGRSDTSTGLPNSTQETFRRQIAANVKSIASARGLGVVDLDSLTNYASATGGWVDPAYCIADGVHESTVGSAAERTLYKAAFIEALQGM